MKKDLPSPNSTEYNWSEVIAYNIGFNDAMSSIENLLDKS